jgi:hypothetical protein
MQGAVADARQVVGSPPHPELQPEKAERVPELRKLSFECKKTFSEANGEQHGTHGDMEPKGMAITSRHNISSLAQRMWPLVEEPYSNRFWRPFAGSPGAIPGWPRYEAEPFWARSLRRAFVPGRSRTPPMPPRFPYEPAGNRPGTVALVRLKAPEPIPAQCPKPGTGPGTGALVRRKVRNRRSSRLLYIILTRVVLEPVPGTVRLRRPFRDPF